MKAVLDLDCVSMRPSSHSEEKRRLPEDYRCICGSLLARMLAEGLELKCRRCKRAVIVPWNSIQDGSRTPVLEVDKRGENAR
ncbi:MAG: hypothetical protein MJD61_03650 [Proteobacteria bacterium]|nr:hypothetical protein [Pseudomonadota bacterium]